MKMLNAKFEIWPCMVKHKVKFININSYNIFMVLNLYYKYIRKKLKNDIYRKRKRWDINDIRKNIITSFGQSYKFV